jgi:hypothetical protein
MIQPLFREVNKHIHELNGRFGHDEFGPSEYLCECGNPSCHALVPVPYDEFQRVRRHPEEFIVLPGHEQGCPAEVVHRDARWVVVHRVAAGSIHERLP